MLKTDEKPTRFLPEHIIESLDHEVPAQERANNVCLFNFEASNIAADTVSSYVFENSDVQVHTIVDRQVPAWVKEGVDVIIMSYSGDSEEIDEVYSDAKKRTNRIHCITSGGKLRKLAEEGGDDLHLLPAGLTNSEATGYEIGILASLYQALGVEGITDSLREMVPDLKRYRDSVWDSAQAKDLAESMSERIPVIYCIGELRAVHKRWKMLVNQVEGRLAFSGELPEFDHNEIVSWTEDKDNKAFVIIMFRAETESPLLNHIVRTVTDLLPEYDVNIKTVELDGRLMERGIRGIILADAVVNCMKEAD